MTLRQPRSGNTEAHFQCSVDGAGQAVIMLDPTGAVLSLSFGAERLVGYATAGIVKQHFSVFFSANDRLAGRPDELLARARTDGYVQCSLAQAREDGSIFPAAITLTAMRDGENALTGFVEIMRDDRVEDRSIERFRPVVKFAPNAMVMIDAEARICMINGHAEQIFGYGPGELLGQPIETLVPARLRARPGGRCALFDWASEARSMGDIPDLHALCRDGSEVPIDVGLTPIGTDEGTFVLSAVFDISDRKQKEVRIVSALKEKELMLGEIHHRVKNNLQVVCSLLDLQSAQITDPVALRLVTESQNRVKSMALIHRMLYESKDFGEVDFRRFLEHLVPSLLAAYASDPERIVISINATDVSLPIDTAIPCGLLVNELISNAIRHAFPLGRTGVISIDAAEPCGDDVVLSVSDDGVGIPDTYEIDGAASLGLQLVTLFADQIGAQMTVQRRDPTRIALRFPISRLK